VNEEESRQSKWLKFFSITFISFSLIRNHYRTHLISQSKPSTPCCDFCCRLAPHAIKPPRDAADSLHKQRPQKLNSPSLETNESRLIFQPGSIRLWNHQHHGISAAALPPHVIKPSHKPPRDATDGPSKQELWKLLHHPSLESARAG
jgi:hypothetical protein